MVECKHIPNVKCTITIMDLIKGGASFAEARLALDEHCSKCNVLD